MIIRLLVAKIELRASVSDCSIILIDKVKLTVALALLLLYFITPFGLIVLFSPYKCKYEFHF